MKFERFFNFISYAVVLCGFLALWISGSFGPVATVLFVAAVILAWGLEQTRWQLTERVGTVLVFILVPLFYVAWKYRVIGFGSSEAALAGVLARLILSLSAIKLLQKKGDRDWLFLYLMSFFQILLAAALSISPLYLATLILYLFTTVLAVIAFEIRKTQHSVSTLFPAAGPEGANATPWKKLPAIAVALLLLIIVFAGPLFFMLPRVGGAGFGASHGRVSGLTGFSDEVRLGDIGRIQQSDEIVMRVRLDESTDESSGSFRWRGIALDTFNKRGWKRSKTQDKEPFARGERDFFLLDFSSGKSKLVGQTIYLEPMDTPVLFALSRPIVVQGSFRSLAKDTDGGLSFLRDGREGFERISYKVLSDRWLPAVDDLRKDNGNYSSEDYYRFLQLPAELDDRIGQLAAEITRGKNNRFDKAKAIEEYLQTEFGYTLEQKASGNEPLADFLFRVKEGHCEYFATAMAVMLRTQGIATRIVNGFQKGEYNEAADVFVVRQRNAHSWVEVYFPKERAWVPFDPTPSAGQNLSVHADGVLGSFGKYFEALETFWIQYFVAYDNQEQRSLFRSVRTGFTEYQAKLTGWLNAYQDRLQDWWQRVRGDRGFQASAWAIAYGAAYLIGLIAAFLILQWLYRRIIKLQLWARLLEWWNRRNQKSIVEFYERMQRVLANQGFQREPHQTPLEFAYALGMPEAVRITEKYNRVRFGEKNLTPDEAGEIETWLMKLENNSRGEVRE